MTAFVLMTANLLLAALRSMIRLPGIYLFSVALIVLLFGLRWETGTDWNYYKDYFEGTSNTTLVHAHVEPGYIAFVRLISLITDNYSVYLMVHSVLLWFLIARFNQKFSSFPALSLVLVFIYIYPYLGAERQLLAVAFSWASLSFVLTKEPVKFYMTMFLAASFHFSAFVFIPAYFISTNKLGKYSLLLMSALVAVFLLLGSSEFLVRVLEVFAGASGKSYEAYYKTISADSFTFFGTAKKCLVLALIFIFNKALIASHFSMRYIVIRNLIVLGILLHFLFGTIIPIFVMRASLYFNALEGILLIHILSIIKGIKFKALFIPVILGYCYFYLYRALQIYQDLFFPYCQLFEEGCRAHLY